MNPMKKIWLNLYFLQICKLASLITNLILGKKSITAKKNCRTSNRDFSGKI